MTQAPTSGSTVKARFISRKDLAGGLLVIDSPAMPEESWLTTDVVEAGTQLEHKRPPSDTAPYRITQPATRMGTAKIQPAAPRPASDTGPDRTAERLILNSLSSEFAELMTKTRSDTVTDGVASRFSAGLDRLVARYGDVGIRFLFPIVTTERLPITMTVEMLRALGRVPDVGTHGRRFQLLARALEDSRPTVRDEAALALLDLGDTRAKGFVLAAAAREELASLSADLLETAAQME